MRIEFAGITSVGEFGEQVLEALHELVQFGLRYTGTLVVDERVKRVPPLRTASRCRSIRASRAFSVRDWS
jgi:hypothetical protein